MSKTAPKKTAGRLKKDRLKTGTWVQLTESDIEALRKIADSEERTMAAQVRVVVREYLRKRADDQVTA